MKRTPFVHISILVTFLIGSIGPIPLVRADEFILPKPGVMVRLSPEFQPAILKGIKVNPDNPFSFDFILDTGDQQEKGLDQLPADLKNESTKLIKYFLATLTTPEDDLWVNLSPYEKNRIIPQSFGLTEMGRDLLAEDYMLKQITASLIYPEDRVGKKFWDKVYAEAQKKFGTTNIPVNTFNKVWIVPEKALVYENPAAGTAYIVESKLKVMLEQDYLALAKSTAFHPQKGGISALGSQIVRQIVIPELTKEVNEGKNFAQLRQVYNSLILATWYKKKIKDSILAQVYEDKMKVAGVGYNDSLRIGSIYQRYLQAFKKGVYNFIKEEIDPMTQESIPRKYFSGGTSFSNAAMNAALQFTRSTGFTAINIPNRAQIVKIILDRADKAMNNPEQGPSQMNFQFAAGSRIADPREAASAKVAFESVRDAVNGQERFRPFIFYHSKIFLDDLYGGPAMFEKLTQLLSRDEVHKLYQLGDFKQNGVGSKEEALSAFKKDLEELKEKVSYYDLGGVFPNLRGELHSEPYGNQIQNFIKSFVSKYFSNENFSNEALIELLKYLQHNLGIWQPGHINTLNLENMVAFVEAMSRYDLKARDRSSFMLDTPGLISLLVSKGFITAAEGQELRNNWEKLAVINSSLEKMPRLADLSGVKAFDTTSRIARRMIPGGDISKFIGEYYELTNSIYALLSRVFFTIGAHIEGKDYAPAVANHPEVPGFEGSGLAIRNLRKGYYRDWNNLWQLQSDQSLPKSFLSFNGDTSQLKSYFQRSPQKMIDVFIYAAQNGIQIDDGLLEAIRGINIRNGNESFPAEVGRSFKKLMGLEGKITPLLVRMHEIGLLDQLWPELAALNNYFPGGGHILSLSYHTLFLLHYSEDLMPELIKANHKEDVYQHVMGDNTSRLMYRFAVIFHDADKSTEYQHLGRPHPLANSLIQNALKRFPGMEIFSNPLAFLVWHHHDLNARGHNSPPGPIAHRDLLDITSPEYSQQLNASLVDVWYLLTIADAYSVDPRRGSEILSPKVHDLHTGLAEYYSKTNAADREAIRKKWQEQADAEDVKIREFYRDNMSIGDIRQAFATFVPPGEFTADEFTENQPASALLEAIGASGIPIPPGKNDIDKLNKILDRTDLRERFTGLELPPQAEDLLAYEAAHPNSRSAKLNRMRLEAKFSSLCPRYRLYNLEKALTEEIKISDSQNGKTTRLLSQLPYHSYFKQLYDDYTRHLPMIYLREINAKDGTDLAHEMVMYALMKESSNPDFLLARATEIETAVGNLLNVTVNFNQDREGIMYKIMGLMAALGLNIVHSQVRTLNHKMIMDQLEGYFIPGAPDLEAIGPKLEKLLKDKGIIFSRNEFYDDEERLDVKHAMPILLRALLTGKEDKRITIDEIFKITGMKNIFEKQQKNLRTKTAVSFKRDIKIDDGSSASRCFINTADRNGILYTIARIAGEGFGFNIETQPSILTTHVGVSDLFIFSKRETGQRQGRALTKQEKDVLKQWYQFFFDLDSYDNDYLQKAVEYLKTDTTDQSLERFLAQNPAPSNAAMLSGLRNMVAKIRASLPGRGVQNSGDRRLSLTQLMRTGHAEFSSQNIRFLFVKTQNNISDTQGMYWINVFALDRQGKVRDKVGFVRFSVNKEKGEADLMSERLQDGQIRSDPNFVDFQEELISKYGLAMDRLNIGIPQFGLRLEDQWQRKYQIGKALMYLAQSIARGSGARDFFVSATTKSADYYEQQLGAVPLDEKRLVPNSLTQYSSHKINLDSPGFKVKGFILEKAGDETIIRSDAALPNDHGPRGSQAMTVQDKRLNHYAQRIINTGPGTRYFSDIVRDMINDPIFTGDGYVPSHERDRYYEVNSHGEYYQQRHAWRVFYGIKSEISAKQAEIAQRQARALERRSLAIREHRSMANALLGLANKLKEEPRLVAGSREAKWAVLYRLALQNGVGPADLTREIKNAYRDAGMDRAMSNTGGIDLTPAQMNLQTNDPGADIKFRLDPSQLDQLKNSPGFIPVIINIQPMTDLEMFLGIKSR